MIIGTIWDKLVTTLDKANDLSYINNVFEGRRFAIEPDSMPCIMLEPNFDNEILKEMNQWKDIQAGIDLYVFSSVVPNELDKSIVGDNHYKGIYDVTNDIRAVLQSSYTLGNTVIDTKIEEILFDTVDVDKYPVRGALMPLRIHYRQLNGE